MMFCGHEAEGPVPSHEKKMYWKDLGDLVLVVLLSPVVYVFVTRLPAFAAVVFSSLLVSG
jgi:hypothetical protein